jgi:hypothetical protein
MYRDPHHAFGQFDLLQLRPLGWAGTSKDGVTIYQIRTFISGSTPTNYAKQTNPLSRYLRN